MEQDFIDKDAEFLAWIESNPDGYLLNTYRKPSPKYLVLHRATCPSFKRNCGEYWTKTYRKICATDPNALHSWARREMSLHAIPTPCKRCCA